MIYNSVSVVLFKVKRYSNIFFYNINQIRRNIPNFPKQSFNINGPDLIYHNITILRQVSLPLIEMHP